MSEAALDWVPEERARYTGLGAIVVGTAGLAGLSLLVALTMVFEVAWPLLVPVAVFWALLVGSIDRWLISSTHGVLGGSRVRLFVPRLLVALLFGVIIAEPFVLTVFSSAIEREVADERSAQVQALESRLRECNPADPAAAVPAGCAESRVTVGSPPDGALTALDDTVAQRARLLTEIGDAQKELARRNDIARRECNGSAGPGLSGDAGEGPNCARNRDEADRFRQDSDLAGKQAAVGRLDRRITELTAAAGDAIRAYGAELNEAILARTAEFRAHQGPVGLLERTHALSRLGDRDFFVLAAHWLVRLFLIVIDCLPVLAKLLGGTTAYDRIVAARLASASRTHELDLRVRETFVTAYGEIELRQTERDVRARLEELEDEDRERRLARSAELDAVVADLAARLRVRGG
ncbi:DUF4407 domain-containing protein [Actinocorallia lasiicapitis]